MSVTYVGIILALWVFIAALLFVKGAFWLISLGSILIFLTSFREFWRMLQSQFGSEQPPPKGGGFRFRLEAGLIDPSGR
jgi:predicted signal transduction protein with EAL and GGDEF domain